MGTSNQSQGIVRLIEFWITDFCRIKAVRYKIRQAALNIVAGKNQAGKTSVLNSIMYVLAGLKYMPLEQPTRHGAAKPARVMVCLSEDGQRDFTATRTANGSQVQIEPAHPSGQRGQALIDTFIDYINLDPAEFCRLGNTVGMGVSKDREEQIAMLKSTLTYDLDLGALAEEDKVDIEARRLANNEVDNLKGQLAHPRYAIQPGLPDKPLDLEPLLQKKRQAEEHNANFVQLFHDYQRVVNQVSVAESDQQRNDTFITDTHAKIERLVADLEVLQPGIAAAAAIHDSIEAALRRTEALPEVDDSMGTRLKGSLDSAYSLSLSYISHASRRKQEAEDGKAEAQKAVKAADRQVTVLRVAVAAAKVALEKAVKPEQIPTRPIDDALDEARRQNAAILVAEERKGLEKQLAEARSRVAGLTEKITNREAQRRYATANAKMPVEGLSYISEGKKQGVYFKDIPWKQLSGAEQMRIATQIALAHHPRLRFVLIHNGEAFDTNGLADLEALAEAEDFVVLMARVGDLPEGYAGVYIEEGESTIVQEGKPPAEAKKRRLKKGELA